MRLIDADALIEKLLFVKEAENEIYGRGSWRFATKCIRVIEDAPTIEPERKKGKWILYKIEHGKCPFCGHSVDLMTPEDRNYCSNCGADMRGEEDGN